MRKRISSSPSRRASIHPESPAPAILFCSALRPSAHLRQRGFQAVHRGSHRHLSSAVPFSMIECGPAVRPPPESSVVYNPAVASVFSTCLTLCLTLCPLLCSILDPALDLALNRFPSALGRFKI